MAYFNIDVGGTTYQARPGQNGQYSVFDQTGNALPGFSIGQYGDELQIRQGDNPIGLINPATSTWGAPGTTTTGAVTPSALPNAIPGVNPTDYQNLVTAGGSGLDEATLTNLVNQGLISVEPGTGRIVYHPSANTTTYDPTDAGRLYGALNNDTITTPNVPVPRETGGDVATGLGGMLPMYQNSLQALMDLPANIDEWMGDIVGRYKVTGRDITDTFNKAANARAGKGIMGGTQAENLNANLLSELRRDVQDKQTSALADALKLKTSAILGTPSATQGPLSLFNQLYGTQANEALGWANIAASLLQSNY